MSSSSVEAAAPSPRARARSASTAARYARPIIAKPGNTGAALLPSHPSLLQYLKYTRFAAARRGSCGDSKPERLSVGAQLLLDVRLAGRAAQLAAL